MMLNINFYIFFLSSLCLHVGVIMLLRLLFIVRMLLLILHVKNVRDVFLFCSLFGVNCLHYVSGYALFHLQIVY